MKILILSSLAYSLTNFRGRLLFAMSSAGHEVIACAPDEDREVKTALATMGIGFRCTPMGRTSSNPFGDLRTLWAYVRLIRQERPDVVLAYTQKPIIYGGLAARLCGVKGFHVLMSGLGYVFGPEAEHRRLLRAIVRRLYRAGVRRAKTIFVFNGDDRNEMIRQGIIHHDQHVVQVPGSGVDIDYYAHQPMPAGPPCFLMIARLMRDKGVMEYVDAARKLKQRYPETRFHLLGRIDTDNPTGFTPAQINGWAREGIVEYHEETRDVRPFLAMSHIFVLPSYYREGLPRTLLEALATGRPIITTDMPGCREPVIEGYNGFLVPPRNSGALASMMERFLSDPSLAPAMSARARQTAVTHYDVEKVNALLLDSMQLGPAHHQRAPVQPLGTPRTITSTGRF
ncbi:glycosyltransferase family 4 protein [Rhizorhapis sp. SPR117]|uniref:glycosyltransferase family 4 protein n=1 Tax=Rhizorhapis sp. SPR117 TaxID=2912611 RepID=UPI001F466FA4|nr:glycosyltransferase family 4 protein [Rhizorhapis sp. SPR117]